MSTESKCNMARRQAGRSLLKPWVTALTFQAQGSLVCALRGPDGLPRNDAVRPLVRALRATVVHDARGLHSASGFVGDGTGMCGSDEVDAFFEGVDKYPQHWYVHMIHAAEVVAALHPNPEIREFWKAVYARAAERLHFAPEDVDAMVARLSGDGRLVQAAAGPCPVCGDDELVDVVLTVALRARLRDEAARADSVGLCANCLTPRTAGA